MRLLTILCVLVNVMLAIVMVSALVREEKKSSHTGGLTAYDDCQFYVGKDQRLLLYAQDFELCGVLMALPPQHPVSLTW